MMIPISGSPVVFGSIPHAPVAVSTSPCRLQPRERRGATRPRGHLCSWTTASDRECGRAGRRASRGPEWGDRACRPWYTARARCNGPARSRVPASTRPRSATARTGASPGCRPVCQRWPELYLSTGPDGQRYAIGGEVPIDLSAVPGNPQATLQKALTIRRAALAPTDPSERIRLLPPRQPRWQRRRSRNSCEAQSTDV